MKFLTSALFLALIFIYQIQISPAIIAITNDHPRVVARVINNYRFGGYTGSLKPSPPHADGNPERAIVVEWSDKNYRFVFWHEASYVPFWELADGTGLNYQFFEGAHGSGELFNQYGRLAKNSIVEILNPGPGEVRIKWTYYNVNKDTGKRVSKGVEYFTFHPNGLGLRVQKLYPITSGSYEPMEMMIMNPKGTYWWNNIPKDKTGWYKTFTLLDVYSSKKREEYAKPTANINEAKIRQEGSTRGAMELAKGLVVRVHLKDLDPFAIYGEVTGLANDMIMEVGRWGYPHFVHWPIGWLNSEWKEATRREIKTYPTHTSIIGVNHQGKGPYKWLIGVSDASNEVLKTLARQWLANPNKIPDDWEEKEIISLSSGWNQITWLDTLGYTAKSALDDVNHDCGAKTGSVVAKKTKDWWEAYVKNYGGKNFGLNSGKSYYVNITRDCSWQP